MEAQEPTLSAPTPAAPIPHVTIAAPLSSAHQSLDGGEEAQDSHADAFPASAHLNGGAAVPRKPFQRSLTTPLSSRLGALRHPSWRDTRSQSQPQLLSQDGSTAAASTNGSSASSLHGHLPDLFADTLQLPISTLLQIIPPHLLDPSHERLSAMSLQVPVTSIEALLEAYRALNWLCSQGTRPKEHQGADEGAAADPQPLFPAGNESEAGAAPQEQPQPDFDLAELLQRVADVAAGQAAEKDVELTLVHDVDAAPVDALTGSAAELSRIVKGAEGAIRFVLTHILSRVVEAARPRSTVEIQLLIAAPRSNGTADEAGSQEHEATFRVAVTLWQSPEPGPSYQPAPSIEVLRSAGVLLDTEHLEVAAASGQAIRQTATLPVRAVRSQAKRQPSHEPLDKEARQRFLPYLRLGEEPSAEELSRFKEQSVRGQKVALYSRPSTRFARHLTELLASWGCQTTELTKEGLVRGAHHPGGDGGTGGDASDSDSEGYYEPPRTAVALSEGRPSIVRFPSDVGMGAELSASQSDGAAAQASQGSAPPTGPTTAILDPVTGIPISLPPRSAAASSTSANPRKSLEPYGFVMIDDSIDTLQRELLRMRSAISVLNSVVGPTSPPATALGRKGLAVPQLTRVLSSSGLAPNGGAHHASGSTTPSASSTQAIIYFASLRNYRTVRDVIQPFIESAPSHEALPEVIVVPKPFGARRLLTAIHTAVHKPVMDPFFTPIATSPLSPAVLARRRAGSTLGGDAGAIAAALPDSPGLIGPHDEGAPPRAPTPARKQTLLAADAEARASVEASRPDPAPGEPQAATPAEIALAAPAAEAVPPDAVASVPQPVRTSPHPSSHTSQRSVATGSRLGGATSPLRFDAIEYFSETTAKMGNKGAGGVVIQSPDGRAAGIFFQPKPSSHGSRTPSVHRRGDSGDGASASGTAGPVPGSEHPGERRPSGGRSQRSASGEHRRVPSAEANDAASGAGQAGGVSAPSSVSASASAASVGGAKSRRKASIASSATPSSARSDRWEQWRPGNIYTPEVGIESVLAGDRPPVAWPVSDVPPPSTRASGTTPAGAAAQETIAPSAGGDVAAPVAADSSAQSVSAASKTTAGAQGTRQTQGTSVGAQAAAEVTAGAANATARSSSASKPAKVTATAAATPASAAAPSDSRPTPPPLATTNVNGQNQPQTTLSPSTQSSRQTIPSATAAARPSAQPQAGLLIGAGFAPRQTRGSAVRRAPVREEVFPPIKVLIVEDNPINRKILSTFLRRKKIQFDVARDGREAVDKWQSGGFHLILMDIQLPVMDGIEATKEIRRLERSANIGHLGGGSPAASPGSALSGSRVSNSRGKELTPTAHHGSSAANTPGSPMQLFRASVIIVALTASVLNSDRVAALAAGCNDFLNKPVSLPWLEKKVTEWGSMQYILLAGDQNWHTLSRANQGGAGAGAPVGASARPPTALSAAASSSEIRRGFGLNPDANARALASKLHIGPRKGGGATPKSSAGSAQVVDAVEVPTTAAAAAAANTSAGVEGIGGPGKDAVKAAEEVQAETTSTAPPQPSAAAADDGGKE